MSPSPEVHAALLGAATVAALVFAGVILARNPKSWAARLHAIYGGVVAWWFFSMAMIATSDGPSQVELWGRLVHLGIGMLPGVMYHLNVATSGLSHKYRRGIRLHYGVSVVVTIFCVSWPDLLDTPGQYGWGPYLTYTAWGLVPVLVIVVTIVEVVCIYRTAVRHAPPGTAYREKMVAFSQGNVIALIAVVDFLPVFGFGVYPFGFVVLTIMHAATLFGSIRYRLIEITPEFAAEQILATLPDGVLVVDTQGLIRLVNEAAAHTLGYFVADLVDQPLVAMAPQLGLPDTTEGAASLGEVSFENGNGRLRHMRVSGAELYDQRNESVGRLWVLHDLTDQRRAEAEKNELEGWVRHGQKLETLGVLASGIAHDFNNLLTTILGRADLTMAALPADSPVEAPLRTIITAAERATDLTQQMLTYAGQAPTFEHPIDINAVCGEIAELIHAAVSKKARLTLAFGDDLPQVLADTGQISQVILNLVSNASDALEGQDGAITLRTGVLHTEPTAGSDEVGTAPFVFIEVTDTGIGMDQDTRSRIFDPFFSTKFAGRGLGLATVMGIVDAHGGRIRVETEPGRGTTVTVALPALMGVPEEATVTPAAAGKPWRGSGVALVADDEEEVRRVATEILMGAGFEVAEANNGQEAVSVFRRRASEISLVLLDVVMPEKDGRQAMSDIRALAPEVPIILMSGYTDPNTAQTRADEGPLFLKKPFRFPGLMAKVEEAVSGGLGRV